MASSLPTYYNAAVAACQALSNAAGSALAEANPGGDFSNVESQPAIYGDALMVRVANDALFMLQGELGTRALNEVTAWEADTE